jgi:mRNA interferase MazF
MRIAGRTANGKALLWKTGNNTTGRRMMTEESPLLGEIWDVSLEPVIGSEMGKTRPALVVSNNLNNQFSSTVTVLPITSQSAKRAYPFEVTVPAGSGGLTADSRVKASQIRTIDKRRLVRFRGLLPSQFMPHVEQALKVHLNIR